MSKLQARVKSAEEELEQVQGPLIIKAEFWETVFDANGERHDRRMEPQTYPPVPKNLDPSQKIVVLYPIEHPNIGPYAGTEKTSD
jgi:hypothetical protein